MTSFLFRIWNDEAEARLADMWWHGFSADDIALALGTVNAQQVRDKAHRRGFHRNPDMRPGQPHSREPAPVLHGGAPVTMVTVTHRECHWIYREPGAEAQMCANPTVRHGPWCQFHRERAYQ